MAKRISKKSTKGKTSATKPSAPSLKPTSRTKKIKTEQPQTENTETERSARKRAPTVPSEPFTVAEDYEILKYIQSHDVDKDSKDQLTALNTQLKKQPADLKRRVFKLKSLNKTDQKQIELAARVR